jgi:PhoH-like ATPase
LSIVSRIGVGSKIVLIGDPHQIDNKILNKRNNGLVFAAKRFKGSKLCCQIVMEQSECVRSPLAAEAAERLSSDYKGGGV